MNPLVGGDKPTFFGKHFLEGWLNPRKRQKPWTYSRMKMKQIERRRKRNKVARKSRRVNKLRRGK